MAIFVYAAGGVSARFDGKIKGLTPVGPNNETLLEISMEQAIQAGCTEFIFIVGKKSSHAIQAFFGNEYKQIPIRYAMQTFDEKERDKPWGTTDALIAAKPLISSNFVFLNADDIYGTHALRTLVQSLNSSQNCLLIGYLLENVLPADQSSANRAIVTEEQGLVTDIQENFQLSLTNYKDRGLDRNSICALNLFGITNKTLPLLEKELEEFKKLHRGNRTIECYLPNSLQNLISKKLIHMTVIKTSDKWFGITSPSDVPLLRKQIAQRESS